MSRSEALMYAYIQAVQVVAEQPEQRDVAVCGCMALVGAVIGLAVESAASKGRYKIGCYDRARGMLIGAVVGAAIGKVGGELLWIYYHGAN